MVLFSFSRVAWRTGSIGVGLLLSSVKGLPPKVFQAILNVVMVSKAKEFHDITLVEISDAEMNRDPGLVNSRGNLFDSQSIGSVFFFQEVFDFVDGGNDGRPLGDRVRIKFFDERFEKRIFQDFFILFLKN